ncbi:CHAT domain-containing protein [Melanogaster broomeanus]|nr:CHAT domain-containing protein [Melanogaster broomeanus]
MADLDHSIECHLAAADLRHLNHPGRANALSNFATALLVRHGQLGMQKDIELAIQHFNTVLSILPPGDPARRTPLMNYASALFSRFQHSGDLSDLNNSIIQYRAVVESYHPDNKLCNGLADLDLCIEHSSVALHNLDEGHADRPLILSALSTALIRRFEARGDTTDMETAIKYFQSSLELIPTGNPHRYSALNDLADSLVMRYKQRADSPDLELAVEHYRAALKLLPLGNLRDLEEAIEKHALALELHSNDPTRRAVTLEALATCLDNRFEQMGDPTDLRTAIEFYKEALFDAPLHRHHYATILNNLATSLERRFRLYGLARNPNRAATYHTLADTLLLRYEERGNEFDLDQAYLHCSTSLNMRPDSFPGEIQKISSQYSNISAPAKDFCPLGDRLLLDIYAELAFGLLPPEAFGHHELSLSFASGSSWPALRASFQWVNDAEAYGHSSAMDVYGTAMRSLTRHILTTRSREFQQCLVRKYVANLSFDAASCALRFHQPIEAIEALEGGRSILWSHLVQVMTSLDDLRSMGEQEAALANDFERLSFQLERVPRIPMRSSKDFKPLLKEKEGVLEQIRRIEGFKSFLKSPPFFDLAKAAIHGPVILVNASQYTCDAVIVLHTVPSVHVALPQITLGDVSRMAARFQDLTRKIPSRDDEQEALLVDLLSELWDQVVSPIAQHLASHITRGSRLWWCPTGKFASIPLHAAGPYRRGELNFSQMYVSSYTPTLQALLHARSETAPAASQPRRTSIVPSFFKTKKSESPTPGHVAPATVVAIGHPMAGETRHHLDMLRNRIPSSVPFRRIEGEKVTAASVLGAFAERSWLHLTGPALVDYTRPFRSGFATREGILRMYDISRARSQADFAFVSCRCSSEPEDVTAPDEAMHLVTSLQFSGVRSVVGTLWPVDEEVMERVVSAFYEDIVPKAEGPMRYTNAARSLNTALKTIANSGVPLAQRIAFVHVGV